MQSIALHKQIDQYSFGAALITIMAENDVDIYFP